MRVHYSFILILLFLWHRNKDAERDCTRVLELSPNNVKALFRRSQARTAMENLTEAHKGVYIKYTWVKDFSYTYLLKTFWRHFRLNRPIRQYRRSRKRLKVWLRKKNPRYALTPLLAIWIPPTNILTRRRNLIRYLSLQCNPLWIHHWQINVVVFL